MLTTYTLFSLMTTWILSYAIGSVDEGFLGIGYQTFLKIQLLTIVAFAIFVPISGYLGDRFEGYPRVHLYRLLACSPASPADLPIATARRSGI